MKSINPFIDLVAVKEPRNESQLMRDCHVGLKYLGEGAFRVAFDIVDYPLILKVPLTNSFLDLHHAYQEWSWIERIQLEDKYKKLRPFLPKVYYFDEEWGLMIMKRYQVVYRYTKEVKALGTLIADLTGSFAHDVSEGNVGKDDKGRLKILDMGFLGQPDDSE